jgi:protein ImuA
MQVALNEVMDGPAQLGAQLWRAHAMAQGEGVVRASGYAALDAVLPGGGWPVGAVCELLQPPDQQHEWRLLLPALRSLAPSSAGTAAMGRIVLVGAPYTPFGPALLAQGLEVRSLLWVQAKATHERLWSVEQALRCEGVAAVLAWLPVVRSAQLRRLQVAAHTHHKLLFVMRPLADQGASSPAALRLALFEGERAGLAVQVLKRRGPPVLHSLQLGVGHALLSSLLALCQLAWPEPASPVEHERSADHALDRLAHLA